MGANSPYDKEDSRSQQIVDWIPGISLRSSAGKVFVQFNGATECVAIPSNSDIEEVACAFLSIMGVQADEYVKTKCTLSIWTSQGIRLVGELPPNQPDTAYALKLTQGVNWIA
jgi:hypothetical protein